jgi:NAD(P)-dependent dehydrogenase (short-subunit alcohol dehydrogenase family)
MNKVWLVTGSASGLGRNIAEAVLESGDRLVATTTRPGHAVASLAMNQTICDVFNASESASERVIKE